MNQRDMALLIEVEDEPDKMDQALKQLASYMGSDEAGLDRGKLQKGLNSCGNSSSKSG